MGWHERHASLRWGSRGILRPEALNLEAWNFMLRDTNLKKKDNRRHNTRNTLHNIFPVTTNIVIITILFPRSIQNTNNARGGNESFSYCKHAKTAPFAYRSRFDSNTGKTTLQQRTWWK